MDHVAIDLGGRESQVCVRNPEGRIVEQVRLPTRGLQDFLSRRPMSRVIVETCAEAFRVADEARALGHQVRVVPATLVRSLGVGARGVKTDRRDAQVLSETSCRIDLPSVHVPSATSREVKSMTGMREALVQARTMLVNTVRGWLRGQHARLRKGAVESFTVRVREAYPEGTKLPSYVARQLVSIDELSVQIRAADREVSAQVEADPVCQRLMTVPGVGPISAARFRATVDEVERFANAHQVESYLGLTPGEDSSSERQRRTSITKAGSSRTRWTLVQAAWVLKRLRPNDPMSRWALEVEKRRGKRIAIVALARKLAGVLYAIWRDGTTYDKTRGASSQPLQEEQRRMEAALSMLDKK